MTNGTRPRDPLLSSQPDASALAHLDRIRRRFPGHMIWRETLPGRIRYVARRTRPGPGPHTVVTPDLTELADALADSQPVPLPCRTPTDG